VLAADSALRPHTTLDRTAWRTARPSHHSVIFNSALRERRTWT